MPRRVKSWKITPLRDDNITVAGSGYTPRVTLGKCVKHPLQSTAATTGDNTYDA